MPEIPPEAKSMIAQARAKLRRNAERLAESDELPTGNPEAEVVELDAWKERKDVGGS